VFDSFSLQTLPSRIIEIFAILGLFALIAIAKWTGDANKDSLITIGAFVAAAYKIIPGIVKIINLNGQIKTYELSIAEMIHNKSSVETKQTIKTTSPIHSLEFQNVSFHYPQFPVLKNFSFSIRQGDLLCVSGISGRGKTTILNLLLGFLNPADGCILINNEKLKQADIKNHWPSIAYMRQQSFFIHDSILRNITLEENNVNKENLEQAIHISGLSEMIQSFPEGLNKMITENGKNISGGQQQRIALARTIYKNADLLLLDEPLNELDEDSQVKILQHLSSLCKNGKMIILISHNRNSISYCNKTISMDNNEK
jgi:ABC-type bacteriocin/lantibiotic exporter with double-glycine peptidase domain